MEIPWLIRKIKQLNRNLRMECLEYQLKMETNLHQIAFLAKIKVECSLKVVILVLLEEERQDLYLVKDSDLDPLKII